jgi:hypothetical protein
MVIAGRRAYRAKEAMVVRRRAPVAAGQRRRVPIADRVAVAARRSVD